MDEKIVLKDHDGDTLEVEACSHGSVYVVAEGKSSENVGLVRLALTHKQAKELCKFLKNRKKD